MALITCQKCGNQYSDILKKCKYCKDKSNNNPENIKEKYDYKEYLKKDYNLELNHKILEALQENTYHLNRISNNIIFFFWVVLISFSIYLYIYTQVF